MQEKEYLSQKNSDKLYVVSEAVLSSFIKDLSGFDCNINVVSKEFNGGKHLIINGEDDVENVASLTLTNLTDLTTNNEIPSDNEIEQKTWIGGISKDKLLKFLYNKANYNICVKIDEPSEEIMQRVIINHKDKYILFTD